MEGMMLCCSRPKPPWIAVPPKPPTRVRHETIPIISPDAAGWESRRHRHSSSCHLWRTPTPSIWHAITPSSDGVERDGRSPLRLRRRRQLRRPMTDEGSWNAAWDDRPARWLHGPDSDWLLFGVCSCFSPLGWVPESSMTADKAEPAPPGSFEPEPASPGSVGAEPAPPGSVKKEQLQKYKVTGVLADGRCLFRAIAYGACLSNGKEPPDEDSQTELADDLRARVARELLNRRDQVEQFIDDDFDGYVKRIILPNVWGGEPELLMASHVLQTPVLVFSKDQNSSGLVKVADYGLEYANDSDKSIKVLFHGYGHYDALEI